MYQPNLQSVQIICVYLHSNFSGGLHKTIFFRKSVFRPFKFIQSH